MLQPPAVFQLKTPNSHYLIHFLGIRKPEAYSEGGVAQDLSWGCSEAVGYGCTFWRLDWGWRIYLKKKKKKCIWCTILCSFLEYHIVIQHLHTLGNDHIKSSNYLSPYKSMIILLTIFFVLYVRSWWFIYFDTGNLYPYIPFIYFTQSVTTPLPPCNHSFILCIYESAEGSTSKLLNRKVAEDRHGFSQSEGSQRQSEQGGGTRRGGECLLE